MPRGARRSRDLLVIAEVALTLVLLSAAGLVLKSFANAARSVSDSIRIFCFPRASTCREPSYSDEKSRDFRMRSWKVAALARRGAGCARLQSSAHDGMADIFSPGRNAGAGTRQVPSAEMTS